MNNLFFLRASVFFRRPAYLLVILQAIQLCSDKHALLSHQVLHATGALEAIGRAVKTHASSLIQAKQNDQQARDRNKKSVKKEGAFNRALPNPVASRIVSSFANEIQEQVDDNIYVCTHHHRLGACCDDFMACATMRGNFVIVTFDTVRP